MVKSSVKKRNKRLKALEEEASKIKNEVEIKNKIVHAPDQELFQMTKMANTLQEKRLKILESLKKGKKNIPISKKLAKRISKIQKKQAKIEKIEKITEINKCQEDENLNLKDLWAKPRKSGLITPPNSEIKFTKFIIPNPSESINPDPKDIAESLKIADKKAKIILQKEPEENFKTIVVSKNDNLNVADDKENEDEDEEKEKENEEQLKDKNNKEIENQESSSPIKSKIKPKKTKTERNRIKRGKEKIFLQKQLEAKKKLYKQINKIKGLSTEIEYSNEIKELKLQIKKEKLEEMKKSSDFSRIPKIGKYKFKDNVELDFNLENPDSKDQIIDSSQTLLRKAQERFLKEGLTEAPSFMTSHPNKKLNKKYKQHSLYKL